MKIGVPGEVKDHEYRVGMTPAGVLAMVEAGHEVVVERGAGAGSSFEDSEYEAVGAQLRDTPDAVWGEADMVVKVKEPVAEEFDRMRDGQVLFTYLHLAPLPELTEALLAKNVTGIAYETITDRKGELPLLKPMSEVAGRMSVLVGATYLQRRHGGRGILLSGVPGVMPADVLIIGGGIVGLNAAKMALGTGARVTILEVNADRMRYLDDIFQGRVQTVSNNRHHLEMCLKSADLIVGAVLLPGRAAPKLLTRDMLDIIKRGAVLVDVAVDQGGCFETTRATTHSDPIYEIDGKVHYCVTNMPGAVPRTSTIALTNVTLPYVRQLASGGLDRALDSDPGLREGVNTYQGWITCAPVAESQNASYRALGELL
ncbi:MAG: alanine dehydrogenase [Acidobacteriota bacterium]